MTVFLMWFINGMANEIKSGNGRIKLGIWLLGFEFHKTHSEGEIEDRGILHKNPWIVGLSGGFLRCELAGSGASFHLERISEKHTSCKKCFQMLPPGQLMF